MDTLLSYDFGLMHLFHCIDPLVLFGLDTPYLAESTLTDHVLAIEVLTIDLLGVQVDAGGWHIFGLQFREVDLETILDVFI